MDNAHIHRVGSWAEEDFDVGPSSGAVGPRFLSWLLVGEAAHLRDPFHEHIHDVVVSALGCQVAFVD